MALLKFKSFRTAYAIAAASVILISSCGSEEKAPETKTDTQKKDTVSKTSDTKSSPGKDFFYMKSSSNNIACADCHGDGSNSDRPLTKYFSDIKGADKRKSTFLGKISGEEVKKTAGGATLCWEAYMKMKTPMTPEQIELLNGYYASLGSGDTQSEVTYETIALPDKDKAKLKTEQDQILKLTGDPAKGEVLFKNACATCHGENASVKKVPSILEDFDGNVKSITYNVRFGDGSMPFFKLNLLSNQEIADISAHILKINGK
ncbi:MAG: cytochrome c [Ignavibacteria bacterium]|nr:cytochrome c [Ignavibacteria bacterium]